MAEHESKGAGLEGFPELRGRGLPRRWLLVLIMALIPVLGWPQQAEDLGEHWVHYSIINTSQLTPEVANAIGVQRSASRGLLSLAVLRKNDDGMDRPVRAQIRVHMANLAGQRRELELREVAEQDAIYYLASFRIHNEERATFRVSVLPEDLSGPPREFSFQQQFFVY